MSLNIQTTLDNIIFFLKERNKISIISIFLMAKILSAFFFSFLSTHFLKKEITENFMVFESKTEEFIIVCLLGPLLETYLFQKIPYLILSSLKVKNSWIVLLSGLIFGIVHHYSYLYALDALVAGILLSSCYILRVNKSPFWTVLTIHSLYNLFAFIHNAL